MEIQIHYWLFYGTLITICFPLTCLLAVFNRQPTVFKWLAVILLFSLACDISALAIYWLKLFEIISINIAGNIHTLFNPVLLSFFYFHLIKGKRLKFILIIVNVVLLAFTLNMLTFEKATITSYSTITESFLILTLSVVYYYKLLKELPEENIQNLPQFWIVSAFFISTAGKLIVFSVSNYLIIILNDNLVILQSIHNFLSILGNLLIGWGTWLQYKQLKFQHGLKTKKI